jgi:glycosyltransferase involved in cell wall biosynthesis
MRVLHINLAHGWRGGERQTLLLMQGLRALGVESALVARVREPLAARAREAGFEVLALRRPWLLRGGAARLFDIVHAHEARALQVAAVWKLTNGRPMVATRRVDFTPSRSPLTRFKYAHAGRIIAISNGVRRVMLAWGARAESLRVVNSAISTDDLSRPGRVAELRVRFEGKRVVGCVAALVGHKDHATLLRAARRVQEVRPDVLFVLLGEGELRNALEAQVQKLGLTNVIFEGYQADPYSYFKVFDAFVLTSREEGLGSSILDAFMYGVPVVATAAGGIPELVKHGETGLLCEVGDDRVIAESILGLLGDPSRRAALAQAARKHLEQHFTVDIMAARYLEIYTELTGGPPYHG